MTYATKINGLLRPLGIMIILSILSFSCSVFNHFLLIILSSCLYSFPVCHFGKLIGVIHGTMAVVLLLQFPCIILVEKVLDGDPLYVSTAALCSTPIHPESSHSRKVIIGITLHLVASDDMCTVQFIFSIEMSKYHCVIFDPSENSTFGLMY